MPNFNVYFQIRIYIKLALVVSEDRIKQITAEVVSHFELRQ